MATNIESSATYDPIAQTFVIDKNYYPNGIILDSIRVCFATIDDTLPVTLQVRPTVNGYPSSDTVYPYASITLTPDKVNYVGADGTPSLNDSNSYTSFRMDAPLFLKPGIHCFVLITNSNNYQTFYGQVGATSTEGVQIPPLTNYGSLFKSQNASTWEAELNTFLFYRIYRKDYQVNTPVNAYFNVSNPPTANTPFDVFHLSTGEILLSNTSLSYSFKSEIPTGGFSAYKNVVTLKDYDCNDGIGRRNLNPATGANTFVLQATLSTSDAAVAPILDTNRYGILAIENIINNLPLLNSGFSITTSGSGYTGNTNVTISSPSSGGVQANAYAYVLSGNVVSIIVDQPGSGYSTSPTITIAAPPVPSGNTTAVAVYNGEDSKTGGNAYSRYIARKVILADGFDSGDLRVYATTYLPSGGSILVYYKLLSKSDPDTFDNKSWQLMTQLGNLNFTSTGPTDYRELVFAPGTSGVADNSVTYTSNGSVFTTFKTFAIKIVLTGTSTVDIPKVRDFRAIALPATGT